MAGAKKARAAARRGAKAEKAVRPSRKTVPVENVVPGTVLHLGDGRRLAYGEQARLREPIARLLAANGQVTFR